MKSNKNLWIDSPSEWRIRDPSHFISTTRIIYDLEYRRKSCTQNVSADEVNKDQKQSDFLKNCRIGDFVDKKIYPTFTFKKRFI